MGAPRDYEGEGKADYPLGDWSKPFEPPEAGCPGAWYRTPFLGSLMRFYRSRDDNGGRTSNPELDATDDPLVRAAIRELEAWEDAARAEHLELVMRRTDNG